jgi:NADH-quinone oxidoreductase subunit C
MTTELDAARLADRIDGAFPGAVVERDDRDVWIRPGELSGVARLLKDSPDLDFAFLVSITAVDYIEYIEIVYHLLSMRRNQRAVVKMRCYDREEPTVPSVVGVWQGADLQEREVWDLMGVRFEGHPNMKRILLWEDFPGHPLRKDFLR